MGYGNTSVSSLMTSVAGARSRQTAYNDAFAGYTFDNSEKTDADLSTYTKYLNQRSDETTDPSKQLEFQKQAQGAVRSYSSKQIRDAGDSVLTGEATNTDKYRTIYSLMQAARQNGDNSYADQLQSQLLGLSKTIQQEGVTSQNEARAASDHTQAANAETVAYATALSQRNQKLVDEAVRTGQISPGEAADRKFNYLEQERQSYEDALAGHNGSLSDSKKAEISNNLFSLTHGEEYAAAKAHAAVAQGGNTDTFLNHKVVGNTIETELQARPNGKTTFEKGPDGKLMPVTTYAGGYGDLNAKNQGDAMTKAAAFNADPSKPYITEQVVGGTNGTKAVRSEVALGQAGADNTPAGVNPNDVVRLDMRPDSKFYGTPHYINTDPNAALQQSHSAITQDDLKLGKGIGYGDEAKAYASALGDELHGVGNFIGSQAQQAALVMASVQGGNVGRAAAAKLQAIQAAANQAKAVQAQAAQRATAAAVASAATKGVAQAKVLGPKATPAQVSTAMAAPGKGPGSLPVNNTIQQAFAVQKVAPAPAPAKQWWNPTTWFK